MPKVSDYQLAQKVINIRTDGEPCLGATSLLPLGAHNRISVTVDTLHTLTPPPNAVALYLSVSTSNGNFVYDGVTTPNVTSNIGFRAPGVTHGSAIVIDPTKPFLLHTVGSSIINYQWLQAV